MIIYENGYAIFNNLKFRLDIKSGYYLNATIRKRLHRYVWEYYNGEISKGKQIHHKDGNKNNNNIDNLECITVRNHMILHGKERYNDKSWFEKFRENSVESAKKWHKSEEGKKWHKKHYKKTKHKLHKIETFNCKSCNIEFEAVKTGNNTFCSNKCKSAYRRESGVDDESRKCEYCGKEFKANKYKKTKNCSRICANKSKKNNL